jgi:hypothetical protein
MAIRAELQHAGAAARPEIVETWAAVAISSFSAFR